MNENNPRSLLQQIDATSQISIINIFKQEKPLFTRWGWQYGSNGALTICNESC